MKRRFLIICITLIVLSVLCLLAACNAGERPTKISVVKSPDTLKVVLGGEPNLSGGIVEVEFEDGSTKEIPMTDVKVEGLKKDVLGTQTVALIYSAKGRTVSTAIDLTVVTPKVTALSLSAEGVKTDYIEGEYFDKTGLVVTATFETGVSEEIKVYEISPQTFTESTTEVKITYRGVSATLPVTVSAHAAESVSILSRPTKTTYFVGDSFLPTGISVLVRYNDGTTDSFGADDLSYYHADGTMEYSAPISAQDNVVKVVARSKYGAVSVDLSLTVVALIPMRIELVSCKEEVFSFIEGDDFSFHEDAEALEVKIVYNNEYSETVIADGDRFVLSDEALSAEQTSVTIALAGYPSLTIDVPVTVSAASPVSMVVFTVPDKTLYAVGETVDLTGLVLSVKMSNNKFVWVSFGPNSGIAAQAQIIAEDQERITVTYCGCEASYPISILEE